MIWYMLAGGREKGILAGVIRGKDRLNEKSLWRKKNKRERKGRGRGRGHKNGRLQVNGRPARGEKIVGLPPPDLRTSVHPSAHAVDVSFSDRSQTLTQRSGIGLPHHSCLIAQTPSDADFCLHPNRITYLLKIFRIRWGLIRKPVIMIQSFSVCLMIYGEITLEIGYPKKIIFFLPSVLYSLVQ